MVKNLPATSVQFSCSVTSDSLRPHEPQHARPPCPSPTPRVHPNLCPLSRWCHPTISSSVILFSCPQSFPASESFQMSQLFTSGGQSIEVSASTSVLPRNIQDWSPLGWTGWISLQSKGLSRVFSNTTVQKHQLGIYIYGFPCGSAVKNLPANEGNGFSPWVGKVPWRRKWQPIPVSLSGKLHGQRNLADYSPRGLRSQIWLTDWTIAIIYTYTCMSPHFWLFFHHEFFF